VITVEKAQLALYGAPVYVRKQIVHNVHVVTSLEARVRSLLMKQMRFQRVKR
jgi:4-hydroxy-3-methylbut-2-enyl diphosphate reductase IspH